MYRLINDAAFPSIIQAMDENMHKLIDVLREAPAFDTIPVVRCKDCKYFSAGSEEFGIENDCDFHEWYRAVPSEYDFCSRGVKKDV